MSKKVQVTLTGFHPQGTRVLFATTLRDFAGWRLVQAKGALEALIEGKPVTVDFEDTAKAKAFVEAIREVGGLVKDEGLILRPYDNPLPVVVAMVGVLMEDGKPGVLLEKRAIPPKPGTWALPSGFVNKAEAFEQAVSRELFEELGVLLPADPDFWRIRYVYTAPEDNVILIGVSPKRMLLAHELGEFVPNEEASERIVRPLSAAFDDLGFPLHMRMMRRLKGELRTAHNELPKDRIDAQNVAYRAMISQLEALEREGLLTTNAHHLAQSIADSVVAALADVLVNSGAVRPE